MPTAYELTARKALFYAKSNEKEANLIVNSLLTSLPAAITPINNHVSGHPKLELYSYTFVTAKYKQNYLAKSLSINSLQSVSVMSCSKGASLLSMS